eukprot:m.91214 g.91214  ORF g.91214 m.91214 type:complete len:308 (+) comp14902_c0_seq1:105-1028(+)
MLHDSSAIAASSYAMEPTLTGPPRPLASRPSKNMDQSVSETSHDDACEATPLPMASLPSSSYKPFSSQLAHQDHMALLGHAAQAGFDGLTTEQFVAPELDFSFASDTAYNTLPLESAFSLPATDATLSSAPEQPDNLPLSNSQCLPASNTDASGTDLFGNVALAPLDALYTTDPLLEAWSPALDELPMPNSSDYMSHDSQGTNPDFTSDFSELDALKFTRHEPEEEVQEVLQPLKPSVAKVTRPARGKKQRKRKRLTETSKRMLRNEHLADLNCRFVELQRQVKLAHGAVDEMVATLHAVFKVKGCL